MMAGCSFLSKILFIRNKVSFTKASQVNLVGGITMNGMWMSRLYEVMMAQSIKLLVARVVILFDTSSSMIDLRKMIPIWMRTGELPTSFNLCSRVNKIENDTITARDNRCPNYAAHGWTCQFNVILCALICTWCVIRVVAFTFSISTHAVQMEWASVFLVANEAS